MAPISETPNRYTGPGETDGLPAWTYQNEALTAIEYERVILPSWQFACHVSEVAEPGHYATLDLGRDSIAVVRDRDGQLRAFKNVCRHRGSRLLDGAGRCKGSIVCPYHGWTYGLDGALRALPAKKTFPGLDLGRHGLVEVEHEVLHGLVFIRVIGGGPTLAETFGATADLLAPYNISDMQLVGVSTEIWQCNWKVGVDNNLENYHVPIGHPGYERLLDYDLVGDINAHGVAHSLARHRATPSVNPTERLYQKLAPQVLADRPEPAREGWVFLTIAPNTGLDVYPDSIDLFQILPRTATTCLVRYPVFRPRDDRREARVLRYLNQRINRQVSREDRELSERVQRGLSSHGYRPGPLSALEVCLKDFHGRLNAAIPEMKLSDPPAHLDLRSAYLPAAE